MVIHHTDTVGFGIVGRAERHEIIHLELREPDAEGLHLTLAVEYFEGYFGRPLLDGEHDEPAASGEGYFRGPFVGMRERYGRFGRRNPCRKYGCAGCYGKESDDFHGRNFAKIFGNANTCVDFFCVCALRRPFRMHFRR